MASSWLAHANEWLGHELAGSQGLTSFLLLLVGGVLASLLPCVYPLYPVTAAILGRRVGRLGRWEHPAIYYAGLATTYLSFGVIASLTGGSFNEVLRWPLVNLGIGALFIVLALATIGWLPFPEVGHRLRSGRGGGRLGTFGMGAGAGLVSSACVGPVVVSILISLAAHTSQVSVGATLLAAGKMMLFGMGVGLPLLLIGGFGLVLPKGGAWMSRVQQLFGLLIVWFGVGYLRKGLTGLGFSDVAGGSLLAGALLVAGAVWLGQEPERTVAERTKRSLLTVAGVSGFLLMGHTVLASALPPAAWPGPAAGAVASAPAVETHGNLTWHLDKDAAYADAASRGKPVFIDFHGDWCTNCKAFSEKTLADAELNAALANVVLLKVRDGTSLFSSFAADPRFPELKVGLPFFVITDPLGSLLYKTSDFTKTSEMTLFLTD